MPVDAERSRKRKLVAAHAALCLIGFGAGLALRLWLVEQRPAAVATASHAAVYPSTTLPPGCPYDGAALVACGPVSGRHAASMTVPRPSR